MRELISIFFVRLNRVNISMIYDYIQNPIQNLHVLYLSLIIYLCHFVSKYYKYLTRRINQTPNYSNIYQHINTPQSQIVFDLSINIFNPPIIDLLSSINPIPKSFDLSVKTLIAMLE